MAMYRTKERGVRYDSIYKAWYAGKDYRFEYPQMADVFAYCWQNFSPDVGQNIAKILKDKLETTLSKYVKDSVVSEAKDQVKDLLLGKLGAPGVPPPVALAMKLVETAATILGHAYLKGTIQQNKAIKYYFGTYSPKHNPDLYCDYVLYSWFIDPENGPYYQTIVPGGPKPL